MTHLYNYLEEVNDFSLFVETDIDDIVVISPSE